LLSTALLERWPQVCRVIITFTKLPTNRFVSTTKTSMKCVVNWISLRIHARSRNTQPHLNPTELFELHEKSPARSRSMEDDESRNARRNADQNPEWWDFSQLVKIEKLKFLGIMRYKFELRLWSNLNSSVSRGTNSNPDFGLI